MSDFFKSGKIGGAARGFWGRRTAKQARLKSR